MKEKSLAVILAGKPETEGTEETESDLDMAVADFELATGMKVKDKEALLAAIQGLMNCSMPEEEDIEEGETDSLASILG